MPRSLWYIFLVLLAACSHKPKNLQGEEPVEVADFIEFFPELPFPVRVADTSLNAPPQQELLISRKIFTAVIPDSILVKDFGKTAKPKIYAIGRTREKGKDYYLFFKVCGPVKKVGYLAVFNPEQQFVAALPLVHVGFTPQDNAYGILDAKFQITTYRDKRYNAALKFKKNVYIYNAAASAFTLIVTEPNEEIIGEVINPIDTLPRKNRFSANYVKDKKNFISIRDGRNTNEFLFFIHFEKDNANCTGELKGTARVLNAKTASYQEPGNPCAIEFGFSTTAVTIRETGGCGSYRDIKCFFEGTYPRKKEPKPAKASRKKTP